MKTPLDVVVIGSGLIGLSTAMSLVTRNPDIRLTVIEKDSEISSQQSGLNSGVIHSGIYYKPGSMKSKFCVEGRSSMTKFCQENDIATYRDFTEFG
ncbi:MAG: FAD-dependent oxidoreductase [Dehalococcoidia bacterium]|nr:FAD-dependent oxidoreductase [Dehalococcoidia bacterium]